MAQQIDIVANLLMKVDGAEAGINKLKNSLSKLKMPEGLENSFKKSFANLDVIFARYRSQVEKGFSTKADVTNFAKTGKALDAELDRISKHFTELTGKQVDFKVNSAEITKTEQELTKLINQRNELAKNSIKFEITGAKEGYKDIESLLTKLKEAAGNTKTGQYASGALDFLKQGDLQSALVLLDKASVSCKRFSDEKQKAFANDTGFNMSTAIKKIVDELTGAEGKFGNVNVEVTKLEQILADLRTGQIKDAGDLAKRLADDMLEAGSAAKQADGAMQDFARSSFNMTQQLNQLQQSTQYFFSLRNMINLFKRGVKEAVQTVKDLDKAMTETAVVTQYSVQDMWGKLPEYTANANALGATVQDMYESTTLYYQQGLDTQQAMSIATETMKMARIAGLEAKDATDMMTAALRGFNMELNEASATRINDVYSNLAAKTASDTKEIGTAMQRTASIAHSAGMSFEGTAAFLAQAIETTREPAENLGTAMKTIVARFTELKKNPLEITEVDGEEVSYNKVDTALQSIGVSLKDANGQFRDLDKVFLDISSKWDSLSQTQQRYIATTAAGSRQQSRFIAMMSDYERTMQLMGYANDSAGASTTQFNKTLESLEAKLNKFQNAWKQFLMGIMNDKWTKKIVDAGTGILNMVNKVIDALSFNGKAGLLKSLLSTFTAFTALKFAGRGANTLIGGLGGMLDPKSNFKAGAQMGAIGKNSAQAINQPIVKELQSIRSLIAQKITQSNLGKNTITGPYDDYRRFKTARAEVGQISGTGSVNNLVKQLSGLSAKEQNTLMRGYASTFQAATGAIISGYGNKNRKEISRGANFLNNQRKSAEITAEEYYTALRDPGLLKQAMTKAGVQQNNPAYEYIDGLDKAASARATELQEQAIKQAKYRASETGRGTQEIFEKIEKALSTDKAKGHFRQKALEEQGEQNPKYQTSKIGLAVQKIGEFGSGISQAGMGIQAFGNILSSSANPALQMFGSVLTSIGGLISGLGMGISALSSGFTALAGSEAMTTIATEFLGVTEAGVATATAAMTGGLLLLVTALAGTVLWIKKHNEKIKEAAEEVQTKYQEKNDKAQTNINNLQSWKEDFARLVGGVDENGYNVNLSTEDYDRYLEIARGIAEINPSIVEGYNAQGQAIITNNKALEETLALEKEHQAEAFKEYTAPESLEKLLKARDLSKVTKTKEGTISQYGVETKTQISTGEVEFKPQANMRKNAQKIGELLSQGIKDGWAKEDILADFNIDIAKLAEGDEETLNKFEQLGPKIQQRISDSMDSAGDELKNVTKNSMLDAFSGYNEAADELDELVTPTYEYLLAATTEYASALPNEFKRYFNEGLKDIAKDANVTDPIKAAHDLADGFGDLTKEGSNYYKLLEDVTKAQDEYAKTLDKDAYDTFSKDAVERLNNIRDTLGKNIDLTQGYGKAIDEFIQNEITKIERFTENGAANLQHALNTMVDQIAAAEGALENFNKLAEGSTYGKAASNMSQIFETAIADEHALGKGDQVFWAGAEAVVGRKNLLENGKATKDSALKQMKEVQEMLKGGQEGWDNFKIKWFDSYDAGLLKDIQGLTFKDNGWIDKIDENLNPEVYEQIADALNMSKDSLIAMLNLGRQFGEVDFTNIKDVRKALATSESSIKGTDGNLFIRKEALEAEMTSAGIDLNKQQEIEIKLQDEYQTHFIEAADKIDKSNEQFTAMGIDSMESLVKTFDATGQFTKDEIQAYGEAYARIHGETLDSKEFNKIWEQNQTDQEFGGIPSSLTSIESILSAIESILASNSLAEGHLAESTADEAKQWLFGRDGEDTAAQKFWQGHGSGANGEITASEFNKTQKELTSFIDTGEKYLADLETAKKVAETNKDYTALQQIEAERNAYDYMLDRARTYLDEGNEAYNNQLQTHLNEIQQNKDVINNGFQDLFASVTPESINTDEAQATLNQLYEAAVNNTPMVLTDSLMAQMQNLGIDIQKAIDTGLVIDDNQIYQSALEASKKTAESNAKGYNDGQQSPQQYTDTGTKNTVAKQSNTTATHVVTEKLEGKEETDAGIQDTDKQASEGATHVTEFTTSGQRETEGAIKRMTDAGSEGKTVKVGASVDSSATSKIASAISGTKANIPVGIKDNATAAAEKVRKSIDNKSATIDVKVKKTGISAITVDGHTWNITAKAKGQNNHGYFAPPSFGSAARGRYGQLGPKGKGGLTLTGELGYEVAWLPSENRSMILGANGPQMLNLPSDAVVWNHEQSKKILQQKAIPAGSHYVEGENAEDPRGGKGSKGKKKKKKSKKKSKKSSKKDTTPTINNWSIEEAVRYNIDQSLASITEEISLRTKEIEKNLEKIGTTYNDIVGTTQAQIAALEQVKKKNQELLASNQRQLADYRAQQQYVSWTDANGESQRTLINIASYLNADGSVNTGAIQGAGGRALQEAIYKEISSAKSIVDGINNANKAIKDADEQIADLGKKVSEAFYQWENELTEVYSLTQRINNEVSFTNRFTSQIELELSKLNAGFGDTAKSIANARNVLTRNNATIQAQIKNQQQMIAARQRELEAALSYEDEVNKYKKLEAKTDWDSEATKTATLEWAKNLETGARLGYKYVADSIFKDIDGSIQYQIDWEKFNADNEANPYSKADYEAIKKYLDDLNSAATEFNDSIKEQTDFIKQTYDALREYQDYISDMEDTLIKGVEEEIEEAKNNAKQLSDSITGALKDLLDEVKRKLDERRKQEDNAKTERDISQKQQRLAALRADTAGGHQVEIAQLEKEIADSQQSYQRTLEDQLLDRLQQQADAAAKQRERQIELAETGNQIAAANNKELVDMWLRDPEAYKEQIRNAWLEANGYDEKGEAGQYVLESQFESDFAQLVAAVEQTNFSDHFNALTADTNSLLYTLEQLTNGQLGREDELAHSTNALLDVTDRNTTSILTEMQKQNSAAMLKAKGADAATLKTLGYTAQQMLEGNYTPEELREAGYTAKELAEGGLTDVNALKNAGYGAKDIKDANVGNASDFKEAGFTAEELKDLFSLDELVDALYDAKALKDAGYDAGALKGEGFNIQQLKDAGYTLPQLKNAFSAAEFGAGGMTYADAKAAGYGLNDLKPVSQYAIQAQQEQAAIDAQNAWNAKVNAYNAAINTAHARGTVDKYTLSDAINKGAAIGYGVSTVASHLAAGDGSGGVTWKEVAKAAKKLGYGRTTVASWSPGSSALKNATTKSQWKKYATGGLANYTGPAWLDGTPSKPELVLNPTDTKNFLALRDVLSSAMKSTSSVNNSYGGDATYEININVDHLNNDYDVDKVAERVKKIIVKDSSYRNVTQVRNLR